MEFNDKPLITLAILSFNQEEFIAEAIYGAYAQTYQPLEIIFSDDCSTDKTFQIIKDITKNYSGPHELVVRKTLSNRGTYGHVLEVSDIARGRLIILGAGDDISLPQRVTKLTNSWIESGAWAINSRFDIISGSGAVIGENMQSESLISLDSELHSYFFLKDGPISIIHGATAAYDKRLFALAPRTSQRILSEDGVFTIIANAFGLKYCSIAESLVRYREHRNAVSNISTMEVSSSIEKHYLSLRRSEMYALSLLNRVVLAAELSKNKKLKRKLNVQSLNRDFIVYHSICNWSTLSLNVKIKAVVFSIKNRIPGIFIPYIFGFKFASFYLFFIEILKASAKIVSKKRRA